MEFFTLIWNHLYDFFSRLWKHLYESYSNRLDAKAWSRIVEHLFDSLLVIAVGVVLLWVITRFIRRIQSRVDAIKFPRYRRKVDTIGSLINSALRYSVYIALAIWILRVWEIDTTALAVGSAVLGAALGFGSQGLVQDLITGLSLLAEEQLSVGDYVIINDKAGAVEEVGLRVVKLRDQLGAQHVIFNRTIGTVSNYTSGAVAAVVDISLENADAGPAATSVAKRVCLDLAKELPYLTDTPNVEGILRSSTNDVFLRLHLRVLPQQQETINTLFVDRLKRAFAAEKIAIPGDRVRVMILSDLFKKAIDRIRPSAIPVNDKQVLDGSV
jgi:small conductance mechanosensitive channel